MISHLTWYLVASCFLSCQLRCMQFQWHPHRVATISSWWARITQTPRSLEVLPEPIFTVSSRYTRYDHLYVHIPRHFLVAWLSICDGLVVYLRWPHGLSLKADCLLVMCWRLIIQPWSSCLVSKILSDDGYIMVPSHHCRPGSERPNGYLILYHFFWPFSADEPLREDCCLYCI